MTEEDNDALANMAPAAVPEATVEAGVADNAQQSAVDAQEHADLMVALSQSVYAGLQSRDVVLARQNATNVPAQFRDAWSEYADSNADRLGFVTQRLAEGFVPDGPPSK